MWKYVSRRIKDTFERGAGFFDARGATSASSGLQREAPDPQERQRSAVPSRWLCERRCWGGRARGDGANRHSYFNYLNQTWLGAITWSSALCLGWYASQLIHLRKKHHNREPGPLCSLASQVQRNLQTGKLFCGKPLYAVSDNETDEEDKFNTEQTKQFVPVHLISSDQSDGASTSTDSSSSNDLSSILNSIENKLGLAAIENGQHQDGLSMLRSAANRHHPPALYNLALCYEMGLGVKTDEKMAMELYRAAATLEHPGALYNLAVYHGQGRGGLPADPHTAARLLRLAAHKGQEDAVRALHSLEPNEPQWKYQVPNPTSLYVEQIQALGGDVTCQPTTIY